MAVNKSSTAETVYQINDNKKLSHSEIQKNKFKNAMMPEVTSVAPHSEETASSEFTREKVNLQRNTVNISEGEQVRVSRDHVKDPRKTGRPKMYTEELDRIVVKTNKSTKDKAFAMAAQEHKSMAQYVAELIDRDFDMNYRG